MRIGSGARRGMLEALAIVLLSGSLLAGTASSIRLGTRLMGIPARQATERIASVATPSRPTATPAPAKALPLPAQPSPTAAPTPRPTKASGCREMLEEGGFEANRGWRIIETARSAEYVIRPQSYVADPVHSGRRALQLGAGEGGDVFSHSVAEQAIDAPVGAGTVRLSFWIYTATADTNGDAQYVLLLRPEGGYDVLMWELANGHSWQRREFSLDAKRGQRVVLQFGVLNDGDGARTAMYVDDASIQVCTAPSSRN